VMLERKGSVVKLGISMACRNYPDRSHCQQCFLQRSGTLSWQRGIVIPAAQRKFGFFLVFNSKSVACIPKTGVESVSFQPTETGEASTSSTVF
jgi:hypothetical protein